MKRSYSYTIYKHETAEYIGKLWGKPDKFHDCTPVELGVTPMGFPTVDGEPIKDGLSWREFMTSNRFIVFQGPKQLLDASLKPIITLSQAIDLYALGRIELDSDSGIDRMGALIKLRTHRGIDGKYHRTHRLINIAEFCPSTLSKDLLKVYSETYARFMALYDIPVTDMVSIASTVRNLFISKDGESFWDLQKWVEEDYRNEKILEFFVEAAPPPLQETSIIGHPNGKIRCLDFVTHHLTICYEIPLMVPGYIEFDFTPGFNPNTDIHGVHEISCNIPPGKFKFSPIIQRFGPYGTPMPVEGVIKHAKVPQRTIEDLLWRGYKLSDITFHKSIRIKIRSGRSLVFAFEKSAQALKTAMEEVPALFNPKHHNQMLGGNFLAATVRWINGKPVRITMPTYNPIYYCYLKAREWSDVWRLTELLENPINRNPDEVYTTDKTYPGIVEEHPLRVKNEVDDFVQFDPYLKSTTPVGPEIVDFIHNHPDKRKITLQRDTMCGIGDVVDSNNLFCLGQERTNSISLSPDGGHRDLELEVPSLGYLLEHYVRALNIQTNRAKEKASKVRIYGINFTQLMGK